MAQDRLWIQEASDQRSELSEDQSLECIRSDTFADLMQMVRVMSVTMMRMMVMWETMRMRMKG